MALTPEEEQRLAELESRFETLKTQYLQSRSRAAMEAHRQAREAGIIPKEYNAADGMSVGEKLIAGVSSGARRFYRGLGNLAGLDNLPGQAGKFFSDEALEEQDTLDKDLRNTKAGKIGRFGGEFLATAPISIAGGALLSKTLPLIAGKGGVAATSRVLAKALEAAGQGAVSSASVADPNSQGSDAAIGAAFGGGLSLLGQGASRTFRGLAQKSDEAKNLAHDFDVYNSSLPAHLQQEAPFIPVAAGADDSGISGVVKNIYKHSLPYLPGVEKRMKDQADDLSKTVYRAAAQSNAPVQGGVYSVVGKGNLYNEMEELQKGFGKIYKALEGMPETRMSHDDFINALEAKMSPDLKLREEGKNFLFRVRDLLERTAPNNKVTPANLKVIYDDLYNEVSTPRTGEAVAEARNLVNRKFGKIFNKYFAAGDPNAEKLADYRINKDAYREFLALREGVDKTADSVDWRKIVEASKEGHNLPVSVRETGRDMVKLLDHMAEVSPNQTGRQAATALGWTGIGLTAATGNLPGAALAATTLLSAPHLARKGAQKFMYGDLARQVAFSDFIRNNPQLAREMGRFGRNLVTQGVTQ